MYRYSEPPSSNSRAFHRLARMVCRRRHKDYTSSGSMSLRPFHHCSQTLHLFVVGGYKRVREGMEVPSLSCEECSSIWWLCGVHGVIRSFWFVRMPGDPFLRPRGCWIRFKFILGWATSAIAERRPEQSQRQGRSTYTLN